MRSTLPAHVLALLVLGDACGAERPAASYADPPAACPEVTPDPDDPSAELYDPRRVVRFDLEIPLASRRALAASWSDYVPGTLRYCGERVTDVGVRLKGWSSFRTLDGKAAFKLKFDEFDEGRTFHGLKRLTLNNALDDPTFMGEVLGYRVFRAAGMPAPRANHAVVYVDGELYGLYVNVEAEDKRFLRRWFSSDDGDLYESHNADLDRQGLTWFEAETNEATADGAELRAVVEALDATSAETFLEDLAPLVDLDQALRFAALEALVGQWDGYAYSRFGQANYRLYFEPPEARLVFLPWGLDMALKPLYAPIFVDPSLGAAEDRFPSLWDPRGRLVKMCLAGAGCRDRFQQLALEMVAAFEAADLEHEATETWARIRDHARADPRTEYSNDYVETMVGVLLAWSRDRSAAARAELAESPER